MTERLAEDEIELSCSGDRTPTETACLGIEKQPPRWANAIEYGTRRLR